MLTKEQYLHFKQDHPLDSIQAAQLRDAAFESFIQLGLPTKKDEAWKYTSLSYLKDSKLNIPSINDTLNHEDMKWIADQLNESDLNIVFTNGFFNQTLSDEIEGLFNIQDRTVEDYTSDLVTEQKIVSLAQAFGSQKFLLKINRQNQTDKVIKLGFFQTGLQATHVCSLTQIDIEENAAARIVLNYQSRAGRNNIFNGDVKINMARRSSLQFLQIQAESLTDIHLSRVVFNLDEYANLTSLDLALGGSLARHYMQTNFNSEYAVAAIYGVVASAKNQHSDHYTYINHTRGHNQSIQKYKSILTDQSNSIFRGRVRIEPNAQKASSEQLNNSLMLSRDALVTSIPQLEIYADDVKAGHGSTVGQLNKEEMFYLLSRGIDQVHATRMMAYGFVMEMSSVFESEKMQKLVGQILNQKLNGMLV